MIESDQPKKPIPPGLKPIQKGERRGGSAPGVPNKMTTTLKDAILKAAELVGADGKGKDGLVGNLKDLAGNRKELFVPLLARVLPLQINAKSDEKPVVVYRSLEESRAALRERGIDPDVIEAAMEPKFLREQKKKEEVRAALRERGIDPDILEAAPDVLAAIGLKLLEYKKPDPVP
jgi:hypothetical protein